jgi:hypothetical protein
MEQFTKADRDACHALCLEGYSGFGIPGIEWVSG